MTSTRRWPALVALALGGFVLGLTEFVTVGLLPQITHDVLPRLAATHPDRALSRTGWTVTTYALGVVAGAPTIAVLSARVSKLKLVVALLVALAVGNALTAGAPNFGVLLAARFLSGLPHGAYFGVAGLLAAHTLGPNARARGFAVVLSGLTVANVIGVPAVTSLGQATSWRVAYAVVAALFLLAAVLAALTVSDAAEHTESSPRLELAALRSSAVWIAIAVAAIGFAGFFTVDSYLASITTDSAHLSSSAVPWVLAVVGLGMTVGNAAGGVSADRHPTASLAVGLLGLAAVMVLFALVARHPVGLFVAAFGIGAMALFLAPALQAQLIHAAPNAVLIGPALNQSATNVANGVGAVAGGLVISNDLPYTDTAWVGAILALVGLTIAAVAIRGQPSPNSSTTPSALSTDEIRPAAPAGTARRSQPSD